MTIGQLIDTGRRRILFPAQKHRLFLLSGTGSILMLSVGGNPDYVLPLVPELLLLGTFFFAASCVVGTRTRFTPTERGIVVASVLLLFYIALRAVLALDHTPGQKWIPCTSLSGWFSRSQCFVQAAVNQHYGFRTFLLLILAWAAGCIAFVTVRSSSEAERQSYLRGAFAGCFVIIAVGWISALTGIRHWLPEEFPGNTWGRVRFTQLIVNPSWVWPYLIPALAFTLGPLVSTKGRIRTRQWIIPGLFASAIVLTQQRGGWAALVLVALAAFLVRTLPHMSGRARGRFFVGTGIGVICLAFGFWFLSHSWPSIVESASRSGISLRPEMFSAEGGRSVIWAKAVSAIWERPWVGHGYASWFAVMSEAGARADAPFVLDTAHNFFLQAAVEHGIPMMLVISGFLSFAATSAWTNARGRPEARSVFILLTVGTLTAMLVQEIDYIRPTILLYAVAWASLLGLRPAVQPADDAEAPESTERGSKARRVRFALRGAGVVFFLCSTAILFSLPRGLYPFEGKLDVPGSLRRWAGPSPVMTSMNTQTAYENFPVEFVVAGNVTTHGITIESRDGNPWVPARSGLFPVRTHVSFSPRFASEGRTLSAWILLPAVRSDLGAYLTKNFQWGGGALSCTDANCRAVLVSCGDSKRTRLSLIPIAGGRAQYKAAAWSVGISPPMEAYVSDGPVALELPFSPAEIRLESTTGTVTVAAACGTSIPVSP